MANKVTNILVAGLGGQGILTATDIICTVAFKHGFDVKKSELKGMSQRGGSVTSDVRFGDKIWSPMIPAAEADYLVAMEYSEIAPNLHMLKEGGVLISPKDIDISLLPSKRCLNVAMLGILSAYLPMPQDLWLDVIKGFFANNVLEVNKLAFINGRNIGITRKSATIVAK